MRGPNERRVNLERKLRRQSTDAETRLWLCLRDRRLCGSKFVRQEAIESYVVDFICRERRLIIEVDGASMRTIRTTATETASFLRQDIVCSDSGIPMC
jgi:very-short-patch-repair endonuclease